MKSRFFVLQLFFIVILISNCAKSPALKKDEIPTDPLPSMPQACDPVPVVINERNADDYVGLTHNLGVDSILPFLNPHSATFEDDIKGLTVDYLGKHGYESTRLLDDYDVAHRGGVLTYTNMTPLDSLIGLYATSGKLSAVGSNYLKRLSNLMSAIGDIDADAQTYSNFATTVTGYEDEISADNSLRSAEKEGILMVHAIARYSAQYWANYSMCVLTNLCPDCSSAHRHWFHWLKVFSADVSGGLVGLFDGPHGALVGAIGASVGEAVSEIYDHLSGS